MSKLRIFETDPDARPKERFASDLVGRFRSGMTGDGGSPVSLDEWRVTTGDPDVADEIARLFGGTPEEWDTSSEENLQILTDATEVRVIIDGPKSVESDLKLWGMNGVIIHHCDGVEYLNEEDQGKPCGCPEGFAERKDYAKSGRGPKPDTRVTFRLAEAADLGKFMFRTGSWDLVRTLHEIENDLEDVGGPAVCTLALETVSFVAKNGPRKGKTVTYNKPTITVHGPAQASA